MCLAWRRPDEVMLFSFAGEASDFVRLSRNAIRQAGHVLQYNLSVSLCQGRRNAEATVTLSASPSVDSERLQQAIAGLREVLQVVNEDPYLCYAESTLQTADHRAYAIPDVAEIMAMLNAYAQGLDLVGLWASGEQYYGFASSFGQCQWHSMGSFNLDASVHLPSGPAAKVAYAGQHWNSQAMQATLDQARDWGRYLQLPPRALTPGDYRVYLAPAALADILHILAYGGFSHRAVAAHRSPLLRLHRGDQVLNERVTLTEARAEGFQPAFSSKGFSLPDRVSLIAAGQPGDLLSDQRSAVEFNVAANCASEYPRALSLEPGDLPDSEILQRLDNGLYINNLWYGNLSDRDQCRITGSTRFACFRVEEGRITGPLGTSRFDDSVYRLLGSSLDALTATTTVILDPGTYEARANASVRLPGALLNRMRFVM